MPTGVNLTKDMDFTETGKMIHGIKMIHGKMMTWTHLCYAIAGNCSFYPWKTSGFEGLSQK